ncbi:initiator tRNA phosphoribosyl transferase [Xylariaceae sp. FL0804]|nr:initiator tRNA phosphoribosyl transferase [Xylariaceae sp. FL0804]
MATEADLVFSSPQANHNFSRVLGDLRRANLSLANRLRSIREDAAFVAAVAAAYAPRPLVANERCGSWYVQPPPPAAPASASASATTTTTATTRAHHSAYFKSTDGHAGQWAFSTRRLNLHLLPLIGARDGCVVVDSTRRGKVMPDALSKTVPIWCCVLNRLLFPERRRRRSDGDGDGEEEEDEEEEENDDDDCHALRTPPHAVSPSEHAQIEARIPAHVAALAALGLDVAELRSHLRRPLRPVWVTPESFPLAALPIAEAEAEAEAGSEGEAAAAEGAEPGGRVFDGFHPIVCCTSSRRVHGGESEMSEGGGYIQGAGDDTENWALGLTPPVFWAHADLLAETPEPDLPRVVTELVARHAATGAGAEPLLHAVAAAPRQVAPGLFVACLPVPAAESDPSTCTVLLPPQTSPPSTWAKSPTSLEVGLGKQKVASRQLRTALPQICDFVRGFFAARGAPEGCGAAGRPRVVIACDTGRDLSIGVALALLCWCFDDQGNCLTRGGGGGGGAAAAADLVMNKTIIRQKLSRITMAFPEANPSRTTLQSVNSFLMG